MWEREKGAKARRERQVSKKVRREGEVREDGMVQEKVWGEPKRT